ncbi:MAG: tRNA (N(6)-L-threonylcarbamoyladenosine(37)-C(2))-methylthiotransferase [bacterium]|nr:tRNA (N(6)-L-threonylcarbamoyladenosine(37)-C(2))-methylthiotransferase [bacterium]
MKIFIETFGCSANTNNSEIMAGLLTKAKHTIVDNEKNADIIILNTCTVKGRTESKVLNRVKKLAKKKLVIAGCMAEVQKDALKKIAPNAILVGPYHVKDITRAIKGQSFTGNKKEVKLGLPKKRTNPKIDIVQISEGCSGNCSYCIVKLAKKELHSYPEEKILSEIKKAVRNGCKEIWITSQDCAAYGKDTKTNLAELLEKIVKIEGEFFVRLGMMNPNNVLPILDRLIKVLKHKKVFKFMHIPVQSGNNEILKLMNRRYTVDDYKKIIKKLRKAIPRITISTDIICGFPSETEKQFEDSLKLINETKPDLLNISRFFPRPGTAASKMKDMNGRYKKKRSRQLAKLFKSIALEKNKGWIGWKGEFLIDEKIRKGSVTGRNEFYKQIVIKKNIEPGSMVWAEVRDVTPNYLKDN